MHKSTIISTFHAVFSMHETFHKACIDFFLWAVQHVNKINASALVSCGMHETWQASIPIISMFPSVT